MISKQPPRRHRSGDRQSTQHVLRVVRLMLVLAEHDVQGMTLDELLTEPALASYYSPSPGAARRALYHDLNHLAGQPLHHLRRQTQPPAGSLIRIDPATSRIHLARPIPVLPLNQAEQEALRALLAAWHAGAAVPGGRELVARLLALIPAEQRAVLVTPSSASPHLTIAAGLSELDAHSEQMASRLIQAQRERRRIEFHYQRPGQATPTKHSGDEVIGVWMSAHPYVTVWCAEAQRELDLRLERIVPGTLKFRHDLANPRERQGIAIRYALDPLLAASADTPHLEEQHAIAEADGSVTVSGKARNLFWAQKLLLGYGEYARALAPPELVSAMRRRTAAMAARYEETAPPLGGADR